MVDNSVDVYGQNRNDDVHGKTDIIDVRGEMHGYLRWITVWMSMVKTEMMFMVKSGIMMSIAKTDIDVFD